jgi:arsenate reductase (glutaredoxin)
MKFKIYHNPRCRKSRAGLEYLTSKIVDFEIIDYIKKGIVKEEIREILLKINLRPADLIRTNEDIYKKQLRSRVFTDEEWIQIIVEIPRLLRRPVIVGKHKAVIGDPVINIDKLF